MNIYNETQAHISNIPLALGSRRLAVRRIIDTFFFENNISANVLIEADDLLSLLGIVAAGNVGSLLSRMAVSKHPDLSLVPLDGKQLCINYGILWLHLSSAAKAFLTHIQSQT